MTLAFFSNTVFRVTVSTSVSESITFTVKRSCNLCNWFVSDSAFWPVPISKNFPSKLLQISCARFCTSIDLSSSCPINCWISSNIITVHGILSPKKIGNASFLIVSISWSLLIRSTRLKLTLKFSFTFASFSANSGFNSSTALAIAEETNRFSYSFLKSLPWPSTRTFKLSKMPSCFAQ